MPITIQAAGVLPALDELAATPGDNIIVHRTTVTSALLERPAPWNRCIGGCGGGSSARADCARSWRTLRRRPMPFDAKGTVETPIGRGGHPLTREAELVRHMAG
jgi:hypothetical protein